MTLQNTVVIGGIPEGFVRIPAVHATGGAWFTMPDPMPKNFGFDVIAMIPDSIGQSANPNVFGGSIGDASSWIDGYLSIIDTPRKWTWTAEEWWTDDQAEEGWEDDQKEECFRVGFAVQETQRLTICSVRRNGDTIRWTDTVHSGSVIVTTRSEPIGAKWAFCTFVDYNGIPRSSLDEHFIGWIYSAAFYREHQVYRDLVPVKKAATGEVGFFDTMSRHFFVSEGASPFSEN